MAFGLDVTIPDTFAANDRIFTITNNEEMQRILIITLIVLLGCIIVTRIFFYPESLAAQPLNGATLNVADPALNNDVIVNFQITKSGLIFASKLLILIVIALIAVINYRAYITRKEEADS